MKWRKTFRVLKQTTRAVRAVSALRSSTALGYLGLQRKPSLARRVLPGLGLFATGLVAGAGIGLLLAPSSGRELRDQVGQKYHDVRNRIAHTQTPPQDRLGDSTVRYVSELDEPVSRSSDPTVDVGKGPSLM